MVFQDFPNHSLGAVKKDYLEWEERKERIYELKNNLNFLKNEILDNQSTKHCLHPDQSKLKGSLAHEII